MSGKAITFTCPRCGHTWDRDQAALDEQDQVVYRGPTQKRAYRDSCPKCGSHVVTEIEE
jgi:predicted RNA-binding Zn-ribbon protein involved in translation (DUF1610 family)